VAHPSLARCAQSSVTVSASPRSSSHVLREVTNTMKKLRLGLFLICSLNALACRTKEARDPAEDAYRALRNIAGATGIGVNKPNYDALLQEAAAEVLILSDLASSAADSSIFRHYASAVEGYKDAGILWAEQIDDAKYDWIPKGRISAPDPALIARYKLVPATHKLPYTGTGYQTVPATSIQEIWAVAAAAADSANTLLIPRLRRAFS
jgi:hypothetical protein